MLTNHHECKDLASVSSFAWIMVAIFRKSEVRQFGLLTIQRIFFNFFSVYCNRLYLCENQKDCQIRRFDPSLRKLNAQFIFLETSEKVCVEQIYFVQCWECVIYWGKNTFFVHVFFLYDEKPIRTTIKFIYFPFDKKLDLVLKIIQNCNNFYLIFIKNSIQCSGFFLQ